MTDGDGSSINNSAFNYSPYGELLSGTSSLTSYHFTGQYLDPDLSLQYHRARWLNTSVANWLSQDPVFDFPANFGNPYAYAGLNPVNNTDLSGTFLLESLAVVSIVAGLTTIDLAVGINLLYYQGGEAATQAGIILQLIQNVGVLGLYFLPVIGFCIALKGMPGTIKTIIALARSMKGSFERGDVVATALTFGLLLISVLTVAAIAAGIGIFVVKALKPLANMAKRIIKARGSTIAVRKVGLQYLRSRRYPTCKEVKDDIRRNPLLYPPSHKFQSHHGLPVGVADLLGYKVPSETNLIPGFPLSQFEHVGKINQQSVHKIITKYLNYKGKNLEQLGGVKGVSSGLRKAYREIGRKYGEVYDIFDRIEPLIVKVR